MEFIEKEEYFPSLRLGEGACLRRVAVEEWLPPTLLKRRGLFHSLLILIDRGSLVVCPKGDDPWEAHPGDVVYIANGSDLDLGVHPSEGCALRILVFDETEGKGRCAQLLGRVSMRHSLGSVAELSRIFDSIVGALRHPWPGNEEAIHHHAQAYLMTLAGRRSESDPGRALFLKAIEKLQINWRSMDSVADLPMELGVSQPTLGKLFRKFEGCTPHQYFLKMRMTYALYALQEEGRTVSDLAYELGYADPFTFSRSFKSVMGRSPSSFKGS